MSLIALDRRRLVRLPAHAGHPAVVLTAVVGAGLVIAGALLPWFTLFAGLQRHAGVSGVYGRVLLAAGVVAVVASGVYAWRGGKRLRLGLALLGAALAAFAGWLLVGLFDVYAELQASPMLIAELGPGLFVSLAGALLIAASGVVPVGARGARAPDQRTTSRM